MLDSDGTEISDNEVLLEFKKEILIILQPGEEWIPYGADVTSFTTSKASTVTITSDMDLESLQEPASSVELNTDSRISTPNFIYETPQAPTDSSNIILLTVPENAPINDETLENHQVVSEYTWQLFDIPWSKIPQFMLTQCANGTGGKTVRKEIIHTVVNELRNIKTDIPNKAFREVARKMADKYPKLFLDTDDDGNILGSGISTLVSQLQDRNWYLNRGNKRVGDSNKLNIPAKKLKELNNRKAGCSPLNWKPLVVEGDVSELKIMINSIGPDHSKFTELLEKTYASQRQFLSDTNQPTIAEIRKEWPVLFKKEAIFWHFEKLTQKSLPTNEAKYKKIVAFGKEKKFTVFDEQEDEIILQALKVLAHYFKEDLYTFYYQFGVSLKFIFL